MPLGHPSLAVDVGQPHLALLVQLPVEGDGVFEVVFVAGIVEKAGSNRGCTTKTSGGR